MSSTTGVGVPSLDGLGDQALLSLAEQAFAAIGAQALDQIIDDDTLAGSVERLHRMETVVAAEKLRRIAEIDARQAWRGQGARSTTDLVARRLRLTRGEARAQTETALALESLPETAAAVRKGDLGIGHAQVVAQTAKDLRPDVREELDRLVAGEGGELDRRQLRQRVDEWTHTVDPDALAERERRAWANRRLTVTPDPVDGGGRVYGRLCPEGLATLTSALDPLARKASELARRSLDGGELPQVAVQRPHVILITTVEAMKDEPGAPAPTLDGVGPVSSVTARMMCCDAEVTPVFMSRNGDVLDMGRTTRQPTRKQRIAVIARDRHCIGCGAPAARCQIHHVEWWTRDYGPTNEDNLCLTCWGCHHRIHQDHWEVVRDPDSGRFAMRPPGTSSIWRRAG